MIKVSRMTGKLDGLAAINTNTLSNEFCQQQHAAGKTICGDCYSVRMLQTHRQNCVDPLGTKQPGTGTPDHRPGTVRPDGSAAESAIRSFPRPRRAAEPRSPEELCQDRGCVPGTTFTLWTKRADLVRSVASSGADPGESDPYLFQARAPIACDPNRPDTSTRYSTTPAPPIRATTAPAVNAWTVSTATRASGPTSIVEMVK